MKKYVLLLILLFVVQITFGQKKLENHMMVNSNGDSLAANIYIPKGEGPFPVVLMRTPYNKVQRQYGTLFNERNYVFMVQDCRGKTNSTGKFSGWMDERLDGLETLDWIMKQPWCDGNIGLIGTSYSGYSAMTLASSNHLGLKAIVNNSGPSDIYDIIFPGGVFHSTALLPWTMAVTHNRTFYFPPYESGLSMDQLVKLKPLDEAFKINDYRGVFWNYVKNHQTKDIYWDMLNAQGLDKVEIPILHVTGWYDFICTSALDAYHAIKTGQESRGLQCNQELVVGPWIHDDMMNGNTKVGDFDFGEAVKVGEKKFLEQSMDYFDRYLKGFNSNQNVSIKYFEIGPNQWIYEKTWPKTSKLIYYLSSNGGANGINGDGVLSFQKPTKSQRDNFIFDPDNPVPTVGGANIHFPFFGDVNGIKIQESVEKRSDVLVYTSSPFDKKVSIFGKIKAKLFVSSSANDADFTVKITRVDSSGTSYIIQDGIQRLSLSRELKNRFFSVPNSVSEIEVDLGYISIEIPEQSSIRIQISSSNYPKYAVNPGTKNDALSTKEFVRATQSIYMSGKYPSQLQIPVIN